MRIPPNRPPTYATAAQARAYVIAVAASAASAPDGPAYLAMPPEVAALDRWPELRAMLAAMLPGVPLAQWADVADAVADARAGARPAVRNRRERGAYLAATHRGLVVVNLKEVTRRTLTRGVLAEVEAFTAARRPVVVFTGRRLVAWPDCRTRPAPRPRFKAAPRVLDVPARPLRPLPTLAASLRALGALGDNGAETLAYASGLAPAGRSAAPAGDGPGPRAAPSTVRTAPPGATFRPPAANGGKSAAAV